ncbi:SDR family oxidoreductase [Bordetella sp. FB-8]|uniref:SDR family oxidoreductase n=1 Tax=Bordetella sp. FB-8 TaxID=1159870 RepID=UPI000381A367|nr:SDR family oxidoreductase [Bordetella sp. FB-8]
MRVMVTGASGFIGIHLVPELIRAGHHVVAMSRSEESAECLRQTGAEVFLGDVNDLDRLRAGVQLADGVIHLAFNHDFTNVRQHSEEDRKVIETIGEALAKSDRPLLVTSGTGLARAEGGRPVRETDGYDSATKSPRAATEEAADSVIAMGVRTMVMRLPQVHDTEHQGRIALHIQLARQKGKVAYIGEGTNCVPAAHVSDVVRLYRLALERGEPGRRYHAVSEIGVSLRDIAEVIGERLNLPVVSLSPEAAHDYFGPMSALVALDLSASGDWTRMSLGWNPEGPGFLNDLRALKA